jgi:nicotinamide-nucleotide amidase
VERGVDVARTVIVGDALEDLVAGLRDLLASSADLVCTSGGLGPTHDDRTMEAVAAVAGTPLAVDPAALRLIRATYGGRPRPGVGPQTQRAIE